VASGVVFSLPTLLNSSIQLSKGIYPMAKAAAASKEKPLTKTQLFANIAETTGLTKKQVVDVFESLKEEIGKAVGKKGPGLFTIPDICKVVRVDKKALPKRQVRNPATGEMQWAEPKPASKTVRCRPLKKLKDMA
jgi:nucleoid DNA-binding protein